MNFSIVTTVYNDYELLRQLVESVQRYCKGWWDMIIFDDYSNPNSKLREYENYLNGVSDNGITVITHDEYRAPHMHKRVYTTFTEEFVEAPIDLSIYDTEEPNMGHAYALKEAIKHTDPLTQFVFQCDCDTIFLSKLKICSLTCRSYLRITKMCLQLDNL